MEILAAVGVGVVCWLLGVMVVGGDGVDPLSDEERDRIPDVLAQVKRERAELERQKAAERAAKAKGR